MSAAEDTMLIILDQVKQDISTYSSQDKVDIIACIKDEAFEVSILAGEIVDILLGQTSRSRETVDYSKK